MTGYRGNLNTARQLLAGAGTQTAGLAFGGRNPGGANVNATESYNGTSWTSGGNLNTSRDSLGGAGTNTAALAFAGGGPPSAATEQYDGSTWVSAPTMSTARRSLAGCGTQTAALGFGGYTTTFIANTEEFTGETVSNNVKTITTS